MYVLPGFDLCKSNNFHVICKHLTLSMKLKDDLGKLGHYPMLVYSNATHCGLTTYFHNRALHIEA